MLAVSSALVAADMEFFVAPDGDDHHAGTLESPFKTIERARDAVRSVTRPLTSDVRIMIRSGTYFFDCTLVLSGQDSGSDGHRIIYQAFRDEQPVITGMKRITQWQRSGTSGLYQANVGEVAFRQLYLDGVLANRARFPRIETPADAGPYWRTLGADLKQRTFLLAKSDWDQVAGRINLTTAELVVHVHWIHERLRIASVEVRGNEVAVIPQEPERSLCFHKPVGFFKGCACYLENSKALIDQDGDWFWDRATRTVWCHLGTRNPNHTIIEVPTIDTLVQLTGTDKEPLHDVEFRGLIFDGSNWTAPDRTGFIATQFAQPYGTKRDYGAGDYPSAMVLAAHGKRLAFRGNIFRRAGANGLQLWSDVDDSDVEGNVFSDMAANAIEIDAPALRNPAPEQQSDNVAIWNNAITRCGTAYSNGGGLLAHFVKNLIVEHNQLWDLPYSGMQIGDQPGKQRGDCGCTNNLIRFNVVHHTNQQHDDGGGIYTLGGKQTGTVIDENYIHHVLRGKWSGSFAVVGIYLDNFTQDLTVNRNVIVACSGGARQLNGSHDNKLSENSPKDHAVVEAIVAKAGIKPGYAPRGRTAQVNPRLVPGLISTSSEVKELSTSSPEPPSGDHSLPIETPVER